MSALKKDTYSFETTTNVVHINKPPLSFLPSPCFHTPKPPTRHFKIIGSLITNYSTVHQSLVPLRQTTTSTIRCLVAVKDFALRSPQHPGFEPRSFDSETSLAHGTTLYHFLYLLITLSSFGRWIPAPYINRSPNFLDFPSVPS